MSAWSLPALLAKLHEDAERRLAAAREALAHPVAKGDASERVWLDVFKTYLPARYRAEKAFVVDSDGRFSQQIDIVIFDRQYSPPIFQAEGEQIIPAESVYAALEAKQSINADQVLYAEKKVESVRSLRRTSLPIPHAAGVADAREPQHIFLGGLLTLESDWTPPLGDALIEVLEKGQMGHLDLGCVAAHGMFARDKNGKGSVAPQSKAAMSFLFEFIALLQSSATVPMIDVRAYAKWLRK